MSKDISLVDLKNFIDNFHKSGFYGVFGYRRPKNHLNEEDKLLFVFSSSNEAAAFNCRIENQDIEIKQKLACRGLDRYDFYYTAKVNIEDLNCNVIVTGAENEKN